MSNDNTTAAAPQVMSPDQRTLLHSTIAVRDWLGEGCDVHDIPRAEIALLVALGKAAAEAKPEPTSARQLVATHALHIDITLERDGNVPGGITVHGSEKDLARLKALIEGMHERQQARAISMPASPLDGEGPQPLRMAVSTALQLLAWIGSQRRLHVETWHRPGGVVESSVWGALDREDEDEPTGKDSTVIEALLAAMANDKARGG